ncbi:hypothetical protein MMC07_009667, partial [Pseudocyphellaria aurata]|nr:hypothetical protein [Pseudocyphellaria aurata]
MVKKGMMTFGALGDYRNIAVLCGSCHIQFDRTSNSGWVFLPTKMKWFIKWEEEDYKKRLDIFEKTKKVVERIYPDEEDYERYMRKTGQLGDPDDGLIRGGLYYSYILEEMFRPVMMEALKERGMRVPGVMPGGPKRWHGAPMAAINRGFVVTGAPEMKLPRKDQDNAQSALDQSAPSGSHGEAHLSPQVPVDPDQTRSRDQNVQREDSRGGDAVGSRSKKSKILKRQGPNFEPIDGRRKRPCLHWDGSENDSESDSEIESLSEESWTYGPQSTSNQKAQLYDGSITAIYDPYKDSIADLPLDELSEDDLLSALNDD